MSAMRDLCKAAELAENPLAVLQSAFHLFRGSMHDEGFEVPKINKQNKNTQNQSGFSRLDSVYYLATP